tara:strand:- start:111 stop:314 length:204 start_codon:yes stop_codon:yes gene_type:complete
MKKVNSYVVFDKKDRWMGGYSTKLSAPPLSHSTTAIEMAIMNADQSNGKVFEVYEDGDMKQVYPKKD